MFCTFNIQNIIAATVSLITPSTINTMENLDMAVTLNTDGKSINSAEFVISYDKDLLSFNGYSDNNALIKIWIDPPHAKDGQIYLSGIIPGGVSGLYDPSKKGLSPIPLVHLLFTAKKEGEAKFSFIVSNILQNDGIGTTLSHEMLPKEIIIKNNPNNKIVNTEEINIKDDITINKSATDYTSDNYNLWVLIIVIIFGIIIGYKLLKYKR